MVLVRDEKEGYYLITQTIMLVQATIMQQMQVSRRVSNLLSLTHLLTVMYCILYASVGGATRHTVVRLWLYVLYRLLTV